MVINMITTVFLNDSKKVMNKNYVIYLKELELLSYLKEKNYMDIEKYNKIKLELQKSHIGK